MKKLLLAATLLLIALFLSESSASAQAPQGINYQAVARNASGVILANQNICVDVQITDGNGGPVLYTDVGNITTNQFGLFTLNIGSGTPSLFAAINWGGITPWLHVRIDIGCTSVFTDMGTSPLLSVPYALNALTSAASITAWNITGNTGTNPAVNFIGTIDQEPLVFKANNTLAGFVNYLSSASTALGYQALLYYQSGGIGNSAFGYQTLSLNYAGSGNTGTGKSALYSNLTGNNNTADGLNALVSNIAGDNGVAIGTNSQQYVNDQTSEWDNTNTSVGYQSLRGSTTAANNLGVHNTAIGRDALFSTSLGSANTATGVRSLYSSTGVLANYNTANGYQALYYNTSGSDNTAIGFDALFATTVATGNTALGYSAGDNYDNGSGNTFIGYNAFADAAGYTNSTVLGENTSMTASDQVRIGNAVTSIGGPQDWTNTSDGRIKLNIREDVQGLSFIKLLRPVTYNKSIKLEDKITGRNNTKGIGADNTYEKIRYSGFIAQEVEKAAKEINYDFSGVDAPKNAKDLYGLRYAEFVVPLVKAVQELIIQNEELKKRIEALEKK